MFLAGVRLPPKEAWELSKYSCLFGVLGRNSHGWYGGCNIVYYFLTAEYQFRCAKNGACRVACVHMICLGDSLSLMFSDSATSSIHTSKRTPGMHLAGDGLASAAQT